MSLAAARLLQLDDSFARELSELCVPWQAAQPPDPRLLVLNESLAVELGIDPAALRGDEGVAILSGRATPQDATPVAQAYAGHQFGGYSPRLGDGRALLLGELVDAQGRRRDLHLKGSGRTPFARGGDGKAVIGPMLREHLIGEAMHALGIPTSRALAVLTTGESVMRETALPGAVLARIAASHIRVGTFEYAAATGGADLVRRLTDYAIARHYPSAVDAEDRQLGFYECVIEAQAALIAKWMLVGFVHGVMNTDNMAISGETIDYGPCAFMDEFDQATVFSSIDHGGRYAYGNQPAIAAWNLARLGETLLPLLDPHGEVAAERATEVLGSFAPRFDAHWRAGMRAKLGLAEGEHADELASELIALLQEHQVDYTSVFRALSRSLRGDADSVDTLFADAPGLAAWTARWRAQAVADSADRHATADAMDRVNPLYIPRNHVVEDALTSATVGDLGPYREVLQAVVEPFAQRPGGEALAAPAPADRGLFRTYCGT